MKKTLIILSCLLLLTGCGKNDKADNKQKAKKEAETIEVVEKDDNLIVEENNKVEQNEDEVVNYISDVNNEVNKITSEEQTEENTNKLTNTFKTLTDFIFYGGTIKGKTFDELSDEAKEKVLEIYSSIDQRIESYAPNYKERIKNTATNTYYNTIERANNLKENILKKYKEKIGEEAYNQQVKIYEEDVNRMQEATDPYINKGKEIISKAKEKIKNRK